LGRKEIFPHQPVLLDQVLHFGDRIAFLVLEQSVDFFIKLRLFLQQGLVVRFDSL
jgi:hypothetical protein